MNDSERTAVIMAEEAEMECRACHWLGSEDAACVGGDGRTSPLIYICPKCGSPKIQDYVSPFAGYSRSELL